MTIPAAFLDDLRARTPLAEVIGRRVPLARSGRQMKGCCPFHAEKTPSFYVYDQHFHCFGCGEHGDAVAFLMKAQGHSFREAVEQLASEAGMQMPEEPRDAREDKAARAGILGTLAAAQAEYERRLWLPEGARALAYLRERGLSDQTIRAWGLGWAPGGNALASLAKHGQDADRLRAAGLMAEAEDGRPPREFFFNRVMIPIANAKGSTISFGARAMGDAQPKYLNGPETAAFSKRETLFGIDRARPAVRAGALLVVVEGYFDVIALHEAGIPGAVAPLGTALTAEHLALLWRESPAPVICFDGDAAGARAALRAAEMALPLLGVGRTLRFATLPPGEDPDTYVRRAPSEMAALIAGAQPFDAAFFALLAASFGTGRAGPRAMLRAKIEDSIGAITDTPLRPHMRRSLLDQFFAATSPQPGMEGTPA